MNLSTSQRKPYLISAQELTRTRKNLGLTQKILADSAGISPALLCRIEKGDRTITEDVSTALRRALSVAEEERHQRQRAAQNAVQAIMRRPHLQKMRESAKGFQS